MPSLKKSKFNVAFQDGEKHVYFNKITNLLGEFDSYEHEAFLSDRYDEPEYAGLKHRLAEMGCLVPTWRNEARILKDYYARFVKPFEFTVELSRLCNFKCSYCYQNGTHDYRKVISKEVMDACVRYASFVLSEKDVKEFELNFIGGEPLLHKEQLLYVYSRLADVLSRNGSIRWKVAFDTHGAQLDHDFLSECRNCVFSVSMTPKEHHDRTRPFLGGQPTFDIILNNIVKNRRHFDRDGNLLIIRYNLDHDNCDHMVDFMRLVKGLGVKNLSFMVVNVVNYDFNPFYRNNLTEQDYFNHCTIALDEMVNLGIPVRVIPYGLITPCHVFTPYSCKVFYDGRLNGCDIADEPGEGSIFDLPNDSFFRGRESMNALTHKLCLGDYKICNLQVFPLIGYLRAFRKSLREGKPHLFNDFLSFSKEMRENFDTLASESTAPPADTKVGEIAAINPALPVLNV
ncbi:MAG TPA: radical SAM protein [Blastocatellia bacterium]|jgi:sulfatase maturation enzyme AslB (radical SAM superfamily)